MFGLQRLLYGSLRQLEIEQLSEKAWYAVLDTLLAMPSLRDDVGGWTLATFVLLLAGKVWSWIGEGRVEILEQQPPPNPRMFHLRLATSLCISVFFDLGMFYYCLKTVLENPGPGLIIIFTFEFAILSIFSISTACRYLLTLNEMRITKQQVKVRIAERREEILQERQGQSPAQTENVEIGEDEIEVPGWEEKRQWLLVLDLVTDAIKIIIYVVFFAISINFVGFPMHVMRDVYLTIASFSKRMTDYQVYRRTTSDMNSRYPDATAHELANDNTCIVCREVMTPWEAAPDTATPSSSALPANPDTMQDVQARTASSRASAHRRTMHERQRAKKLPCGHILHLQCLKAWLERQQACPTCRRPVVPAENNTAEPPRNDAAAAARPGENDANGARPARRGGGIRWINMGPVRIGFGDRQPRRQAADAAVPAQIGQPQAGAQGHPTFLSNIPRGLSHRTEMSTQDQLRAVELRLLRQANTLRLEQAQLGRLRLLEIELEQLRAIHNANSSLGLLTPGVPRQATPNPFDRGPSTLGAQPFAPTFRGSSSSQTALGAGSVNLPEGMTLPAGWTMLPLARLNGQAAPGAPMAAFPGGSDLTPGLSSLGGRSQPTPRAGTPRQSGEAVTPAAPTPSQYASQPTMLDGRNNVTAMDSLPVPSITSGHLASPGSQAYGQAQLAELEGRHTGARPASVVPTPANDAGPIDASPALGLNREPMNNSIIPPLGSLQSQLGAPNGRIPSNAPSNTLLANRPLDSASTSAVQDPMARTSTEAEWSFGGLDGNRASTPGSASADSAAIKKGKGKAVAVEDAPDDEQ